MAKRKTFNVDDFRKYINTRLLSDHLSPDLKHGLAGALDYVLHETGNYKGFRYIYADDQRPCLTEPIDGDVSNPAWTAEHEMRREYF